MGPRLREIACALILDTKGRALLQRRDDIPGIIQPGKLGLFGGHREGDETFLQCAMRELKEEIGQSLGPERFERLAGFEGEDPETGEGMLRAEYFIVRGVPAEDLVVTEGELFVASLDQLAALPDLTPIAQFVINRFLGCGYRGSSIVGAATSTD